LRRYGIARGERDPTLTKREAGGAAGCGPMRSIRVSVATIASEFVLRFLDDRDPAALTSAQLSIQKCPSSIEWTVPRREPMPAKKTVKKAAKKPVKKVAKKKTAKK
jgi:hypothetical protein